MTVSRPEAPDAKPKIAVWPAYSGLLGVLDTNRRHLREVDGKNWDSGQKTKEIMEFANAPR
jgi:hypothetical protein